jgi:hypothetical protein
MTPDAIAVVLDTMYPARSPMRGSLSRAIAPLVEEGVLDGLHRVNEHAWTTDEQLPDWSLRPGDVALLGEWTPGYSYDASVPALEIRTSQVLLRHVGKGYRPDVLRAHTLAGDPPPRPRDGGRLVHEAVELALHLSAARTSARPGDKLYRHEHG